MIILKGHKKTLIGKDSPGKKSFVCFISDNAYVASCLQNGDVLAYGRGKTSIYAIADDGSQMKCIVRVLPWPKRSYPLFVNRKNGVPEGFRPQNLVELPEFRNEHSMLNIMPVLCSDAAEAFREMAADAAKENVILNLSTGYRSIEEQEKAYRMLIEEKGQKAADKQAALPRFSEHHTGLALDFGVPFNPIETMKKRQEAAYKWVNDHCFQYGFMIKNLKGKEDITGTIYEPWHLRYLGDEKLAKYLHDHYLTLDEYLANV